MGWSEAISIMVHRGLVVGFASGLPILRTAMMRSLMIALVAVAVPALSGQLSADDKRALPAAVSKTNSSEGDCEARMRKLDASQAEGEERLAEKNSVIDYCASQYKNDKTIARLVKECANTRSSQS